MDLSIVIINWNGMAVLRNCLNSIFGVPQGLSFEVIVVDNASQDDSVAMIQREFPQVMIIQNDQNRGFAAANNQAFALAQGRHVLLLNNDTLVSSGAFEKSVKYMDENPRVGALGCRIEFPDQSFQTSCYRFTNLLELLMIRLLPLGSVWNERLNFGRYWARQFEEPTEVDAVAGCFMAVRREVIATVGGLDEDFFMYGEDEEWCSRIKGSGWSVLYFPAAKIIHFHRFSSRQVRCSMRVLECMSPVLVLHKRCGPLIAWLANLILLLGFTLRLPVWLLADSIHTFKGTAQNGLFSSRLRVFALHLKGLVLPVWLPRPANRPHLLAHRGSGQPVSQ